MTAYIYTSHISGIMDAVHAHRNFKLSGLGIVLTTGMKNVSHQQVIRIEMYSLCFKHIKGKPSLHKTGWVQSPEKKMTVQHENVMICSTLYLFQRPSILVPNV
jgi:hypothetical protein